MEMNQNWLTEKKKGRDEQWDSFFKYKIKFLFSLI